MPRLQAPHGYYTATEVKRLLNVSDAVVRSYVQKGKIKYIVPPSRKHGFYLKSDVDGLVNELTAFFSLEESKEEDTTFRVATIEDLPAIVNLGRELFDPKSTRQLVPPQWQLDAMQKNSSISYVLTRDSMLLGYINTIPFTANNSKASKCLEVDYISDVGLTPNDIEIYESGKHVHLYVMAMGTNPALKSTERRSYGSKLIARFISQLVSLGRNGIVLDKVTAIGFSTSGVRLLRAFGFIEMKSVRSDGKPTFELDILHSYGHLARQYQEALRERSK